MARYSLQDFLNATRQQDKGEGMFELETERLLEINLNGEVWTKMGSMVAYNGQIKFTREGVLEHGIGKMLKKAVSGEGAVRPSGSVNSRIRRPGTMYSMS